MKFFFHNNLKSYDTLITTFKDKCSIESIQYDNVIINKKNIAGNTIKFNSSVDSILNAIKMNSSNLNKDRIDKYFVNIVNTQKNNGVYIILPYKLITSGLV